MQIFKCSKARKSLKNKIESPQNPNLQNLYIVLLCVNDNNFFAQSRFSSNSKILCDNSKILSSQIFPFSCVNQIVEIQILFQNFEMFRDLNSLETLRN